MKMYRLKAKCPNCNVKSWNRDWDAETLKVFGEDIGSISNIDYRYDAYHICPACKEECCGVEVESET